MQRVFFSLFPLNYYYTDMSAIAKETDTTPIWAAVVRINKVLQNIEKKGRSAVCGQLASVDEVKRSALIKYSLWPKKFDEVCGHYRTEFGVEPAESKTTKHEFVLDLGDPAGIKITLTFASVTFTLDSGTFRTNDNGVIVETNMVSQIPLGSSY